MTAVAVEPTTGRVGRSLGWVTAGNLMLRIGNFGVSIIMARLIAPEEFGVFAVALTVWAVLGTLAEFGLGTDLVRAADVQRRIPTVTTLGLLTSGTLALSMVIAAPLIARAFESPDSTGVLRLMAVAMAVFGLSIAPAALLQRAFRQKALFAVNGTALVLSTATMAALALAGAGPVALAVGQIVTQVVSVVGQHLAARVPVRLGFDRTIAAESIRFCLPLAAANLLSWVLLSVDNLLVARLLSPVQLGLYVLAFNVSSWPMSAVGQAVRVVALPAFARLDEGRRRNDTLLLVLAPLWAVALLLGAGLATSAGAVVRLLYGDRWAAAGAALAGLAVFGGVRVVFDLLATYLIAAGQTRPVLVVQAVWLLAMVPAMAAGILVFGLAGAGWTHLVVALAVTLPAYLVCLRRLGIRPAAVLRTAVVPAAAVLPFALASWFANERIGSPLGAVAVSGGLALTLYVLPMARWWTRRVHQLRAAEHLTTEGTGNS
ncbi:oligosaccharide flippase family protein [Microlunatus capsulatus]|uniref:PST family polysaccharide transporter n=1 Tax=Microlunatus capsulatus TaxID=99117 RepID=A0ABS4ZBX9_9ACTN|nr:oligosaccharide flippase family protein [Microlunatus capsulatus]MBP2418569.1 PST family polysaccharide transporter [Microlunatus capsulatus]